MPSRGEGDADPAGLTVRLAVAVAVTDPVVAVAVVVMAQAGVAYDVRIVGPVEHATTTDPEVPAVDLMARLADRTVHRVALQAVDLIRRHHVVPTMSLRIVHPALGW